MLYAYETQLYVQLLVPGGHYKDTTSCDRVKNLDYT